MTKSNFKFIESVSSGFVDARVLARGSDVSSGEEVRERRVILPESHHASEDIGTAKDWAVLKGCAPDNNVATTASWNVSTADGELLCSETILAGFFVEHDIDGLEFIPCARGREVDLKDTGVGSDTE
jgi:hypothetical protein